MLEPECVELEPVIDAVISPNMSVYLYGDVVTYTCPDGYYLFAGSKERVCNVALANKTEFAWTGKPAVCLPVGKKLDKCLLHHLLINHKILP